jgi:hypothetical protein
MVKTDSDPASFRATFLMHLRAVDPDAAVSDTGTMRQFLEDSLGPKRFNLGVFGAFASTAARPGSSQRWRSERSNSEGVGQSRRALVPRASARLRLPAAPPAREWLVPYPDLINARRLAFDGAILWIERIVTGTRLS